MSDKRYGYRTVVFDALLAGTPKRITEVVYRWLYKEYHEVSIHIEEPPKSGTVTFLLIQLRLNDDIDKIGILHQYAGTVNINGEDLGSHVIVNFFDWETADDRSDACNMARIHDYATLDNQQKVFEQLAQALRREVLVLQDNLKSMGNENIGQDATPEVVSVAPQAESGKTRSIESETLKEKAGGSQDNAIVRFGTDRDLSLSDVKIIVKRCNAWVRDNGKVTEFWREHNKNKYSLGTLRKWLDDPRFSG